MVLEVSVHGLNSVTWALGYLVAFLWVCGEAAQLLSSWLGIKVEKWEESGSLSTRRHAPNALSSSHQAPPTHKGPDTRLLIPDLCQGPADE
jgi:hypothetical protein